MKLTSVQFNLPCRECGHHRFPMEAEHRDDCLVVCARCGHCAGRRDGLRGNGLENTGGLFPRMIGRSPGRRRR